MKARRSGKKRHGRFRAKSLTSEDKYERKLMVPFIMMNNDTELFLTRGDKAASMHKLIL